MDIPSHILDAVSVISDISPAASVKYPSSFRNANSSVEDVSSNSESDAERGYQTDYTTPASSEINSGGDDMQPDDVEEFRDREYPQLKGKTYLDHGGTTVCYVQFLMSDIVI
jgi:molybdenum cofactor sulfurtransferase